MLGFPTKTLNTIKKLLQRQQKQIEKNIKEVDEDDPVKSPSLAESSEPGTDSYIADIHTKTLVLKNNLTLLSKNIQKALLKIRAGTYGKCEKCKKGIELGRLLAMPTAAYCFTCSKKATKP